MDELEITGRFGVEIRGLDGALVSRHESPNTVVSAGVLQLKRWLDRQEYVAQSSNFSNWKDQVYCAGDCRRITVAPQNMTVTPNGMNDSPDTFGLRRAFDGSYGTKWRWWQDRDSWEYIDMKFQDVLNIKRIGLYYWSDINSNWGGRTIQSWQMKQDGYTVASAGTAAYNSGEYLRENALHNGYPAYKMENASYYIFVNSGFTKWCFSSTLGGVPAYSTTGTTLPAIPSAGAWQIGSGDSGTGAAPTVTEGPTLWREPTFMLNNYKERSDNSDGRYMDQYYNDLQIRNGPEVGGNYYEDLSKAMYCLYSFEGITGWHGAANNFGHNWYGFLPNVKYLRFRNYCNDYADSNVQIPEIHIYEALPHPQNPYALKLGTDDGTILPLAAGNTALGAYAKGNQWKVESVSQTGYTVRFSRRLLPDEANGTSFKEIGLFGNLDGHLITSRSEPTLANASGLFARSIFATPWTKTVDQTASIYYEISVSDSTP